MAKDEPKEKPSNVESVIKAEGRIKIALMDVIMEEVRQVVREELNAFAERMVQMILNAYQESKQAVDDVGIQEPHR